MARAVHYIGLDVLRLGAAGLVVADHFGAFGWHHATASATGDAFPFLHGMENIGSIGVEIFFLISGFVIAASAKGTTASAFLLNRAIRVLPALWMCGLIAVAARATTGEPIGALLGFFVRSAVLSPVGPYIDGVVWTLVVEAVFYALIFAVLLRGGFARIERVAIGLGIVSAAFLGMFAVATLFAPGHPHVATLAALCGRFPFKVLLLRHGVFFAIGMLLWRGFDSGRFRLGWMAAFALACSVEIAIDRGGIGDIAISLALWWAGLASIVVSVATGDAISRRCHRWIGAAQAMGRVSYPLYLNHYVLGMVLVPAFASCGLSRPAVLAVALGIVGGSSYLIMRYPERMLQRYLRGKLTARPRERGTDLQTSPAVA